MSAGRLDLKMRRGATFDYALDFSEPEPDSPGGLNPADLSGVTGRADIRAGTVGVDGKVRGLGAAPALVLTTANGGVVVGEVRGRVRLFVPASATAGLVAGANYCWDLELTWPGRVDCPAFGSVAVAERVTDP